ncbi:restriction endonuclease subunit S [Escherichia coli]|uniref:restriction endonuclease subunit S n=1 Tax=Escherichia coli TaxID=562 RepID=UPI001058CDDF|nr:restriction endonuclease subunit S [Escherichia coli]EFH7405037.1 restriction endonuclease subunit S [Escherichia coli]EHX2053423.1 restriction endonuclease subunit S [Escherichia coli]EIE2974041.1 restriction endonuclease subunit S [Escherichia coli]EJZ0104696.1 restriction endonuclease subunit S [Escherichia coli]EKI1491101.1 restriction endonuclease subunit S [Escherichia coli]
MSWRYLKIEDFCSTGSGGTPSRSKPEYYEGGDIPWIKSGDLKDSKIYDANEYITAAGLENSSAKIVEKDSILIAMYGATVGRLAILGINAATNQAICNIRPDMTIADIKYLYYFLKSKFSYFVENAVGGAQPNISQGLIKSLEVPLPSLDEQKRIADILDKADAIRQKREQAIKLADDFLCATFLDMFGDPVENPKKLKKAPITELADVITGFAFKSNEYISDTPESVRLCRGANTLTGYLDWADTKFWPKNKLEKLDNYLIKAGDIILAMDRPWISSGLKVCIFPENQRETYLVQRVARLRPRCESYTNYIYSCIKSPAFEKHCCPTETTVPHISPVELKNFEVLIPPDELMVNFHSIVSIINNSLNKMASGDIDSDALFSKLSQQAFSGHLKR